MFNKVTITNSRYYNIFYYYFAINMSNCNWYLLCSFLRDTRDTPVCYMTNAPVTVTFSWDLGEPDSRYTRKAASNLTVVGVTLALIFQIMYDLILKPLRQSFILSTISLKNHIVNLVYQISTFLFFFPFSF